MVKYSDLKETHKMVCEECGSEYSANPMDYFTIDNEEYIFSCECGSKELILMELE